MSQGSNSMVPSAELWRALYSAADRFFDAAPWNVFSNEMIFGVENPATGQIGWCIVLGEMGMEFGLCVNRGARGFKAFMGMMNEIDHDDLMPLLDSINLTYDHSDFLEPRDLSVLKELKITNLYRHKAKWPNFRSYIPARYPWFLNSDEATFLLHSINQTLEVAKILAKDKTAFVKGSPDRFLVRTQRKISDKIEWVNDYMAPEPYIESTHAPQQLSLSVMSKIRSLPIKSEIILEADLFIANTPICDSEPPWLPWLMLMVDVKSQYAFPPEPMIKDVDPIVEGTRQLFQILEKLNHRPGKIRIMRENWHSYLESYCEELGLSLEMTTDLPAIGDLKQSLREYSRWDKKFDL